MDRQAFLFATASAAIASPALPAIAQSKLPVTIVTVPTDATMGAFYAKDQGFYDKSGLDANVTLLNNGAAVVSGVMSGSIDIGSSNMMSLILAYKKGAALRLVAPSGMYNKQSPAVSLVVLKNSPLMTAKDLEGKIIAASPLKGLPQLGAEAWIEKNGGDLSKVRYVEMPFSEMESALVQGRIAAALLGEPFISQAKATCRIMAVPYSAVAPQFMTTAYFATAGYAESHPEVMSRFAAVMKTTAIWANNNQQKSGAILATVTKLDPKTIAEMSRVIYAEALTPSTVQPAIDLAYSRKMIDAPYPASDMIFQPAK